MTKTPAIELGDEFHTLVPMSIMTSRGYATIVNRGATLRLDQGMLDAATGEHGEPRGILRYLGDEPAQLAKWGEVRLRLGPAPAALREPLPGSAEADAARREALDRLREMPKHEQDDELQRIKSRYGLEGRSRTIRSYGGAQ